jgi:hypothetical protein
MNHIEDTISIVMVQQYLDHYIEMGICLYAYCIAMAVLVVLFIEMFWLILVGKQNMVRKDI